MTLATFGLSIAATTPPTNVLLSRKKSTKPNDQPRHRHLLRERPLQSMQHQHSRSSLMSIRMPHQKRKINPRLKLGDRSQWRHWGSKILPTCILHMMTIKHDSAAITSGANSQPIY